MLVADEPSQINVEPLLMHYLVRWYCQTEVVLFQTAVDQAPQKGRRRQPPPLLLQLLPLPLLLRHVQVLSLRRHSPVVA